MNKICYSVLLMMLANHVFANTPVQIRLPEFTGYDKSQLVCQMLDSKDNVAVAQKEGKYGLIGEKQGIVIPLIYENGHCLGDNYLTSIPYFAFQKNKKWALLDKEGKKLTQFIYDAFGTQNTHFIMTNDKQIIKLLMAKYRGKWGVMDTQGKNFVNFKYDNIVNLENPYYTVEKNGLFGLIDNSDKTILPNQYEAIQNTGGARLAYSTLTNDNFVELYLKRSPSLKDNPLFKKYSEKRYYTYAIVKQHGKWGVVDLDNQVLIPFQYDEIKDNSSQDYNARIFIVKQNSKYGVLDAFGGSILPIQYERVNAGLGAISVSDATTNGQPSYYNVKGEKCEDWSCSIPKELLLDTTQTTVVDKRKIQLYTRLAVIGISFIAFLALIIWAIKRFLIKKKPLTKNADNNKLL